MTLPLSSSSGKVKQVRRKGHLLSHRSARYGWLVGPDVGKENAGTAGKCGAGTFENGSE